MNRLRQWGAVSGATLLFLILLSISLRPPSAPGEPEFVSGGGAQALYRLDVAAAQTSWTPERLIEAGDLWRDLGDLRQAVAYWEAADSPEAVQRLAAANLELQRWPQAADNLAQMLAQDGANHWAHFHLGLLRAAFDPQAALTHLEQASVEYGSIARDLLRVIQLDNDTLALRVGLALADAELWPQAELAFQHAADQGWAEALAYVGLARDQQGKDSQGWFALALETAPDLPVVHFLWGLHLRQADDLEASRDAFVTAVRLDPENPAYYAELGTAYRLLGDQDNAARWLQVAVDTSNQDPRFQQLLALFYAEEGYQLDAGLPLLESLTDDQEAQAGLGLALHQQGDSAAALVQLDSILAVLPDHPRSLFYKARIALETGDLDMARATLDKLVGLESPFAGEAQRMLQTLEGRP